MSETDAKDYYQLLGVEREASTEEIKQAYKEIARVFHPDSNFYKEIIEDYELSEAESEMYRMLTNAYNTLIDEKKREAYDQSLRPVYDDWQTSFGKRDELKSYASDSEQVVGGLSLKKLREMYAEREIEARAEKSEIPADKQEPRVTKGPVKHSKNKFFFYLLFGLSTVLGGLIFTSLLLIFR